MGRQLRKVPANWEHPKNSDGRYQPMFDLFYGDALKEWIEENEKWENGTHEDLIEKPSRKVDMPFYAMWAGNPPDVEFYHTKKYSEAELTHIQLYENTSEGTPLSPVYHSSELEKLCEWAAENATTFASYKTTKEAWMKMLKNDHVYHQEGNCIFL
jgi:hypothetical protein